MSETDKSEYGRGIPFRPISLCQPLLKMKFLSFVGSLGITACLSNLNQCPSNPFVSCHLWNCTPSEHEVHCLL
ncbi:hypothetical protein GQ53DRAFT_122051 [Thozetella sp. PMI_491]|nr:hypothetical protein GQ53DRAFT_122051 [Thozetella sp. PMI_491]